MSRSVTSTDCCIGSRKSPSTLLSRKSARLGIKDTGLGTVLLEVGSPAGETDVSIVFDEVSKDFLRFKVSVTSVSSSSPIKTDASASG